jgi:mannose-1-phosphate guanylyltransferase/mannose-6-phosphate isomerase
MSTHLVIIAGGSGTRFWPKSTKKKPKQFLSFDPQDQKKPCFLVETIERVNPELIDNICVITTQELKEQTDLHLKNVSCNVIAEPFPKNTAACVFIAAKQALKTGEDPVLIVCPADHFIAEPEIFNKTLSMAIQAAQQPYLILFGITPTRADTGFGYLEFEEKEKTPFPVKRFIEKPNEETAQELIEKKNILWNSGIFVFRCSEILKAYDEHLPEFQEQWEKTPHDLDVFYKKIPSVSFDVAILEKAHNVVTFPLSCGWDDIGSFPRFFELANKKEDPEQKNQSLSEKLIAIDAHNNLIDVPGKVVAMLGVNNLVVIETPTSLLIIEKHRLTEMRHLVEQVGLKYPSVV